MTTKPSTVQTFGNYIHGRWIESGNTFEQRNPARLSEVTGRFALSTTDDVRAAVDAAAAAFPSWRDTSVTVRAECLRRALALMIERKDQIARVLTIENGKTLQESLAEINAAIKEMDFQIGTGLRELGDIAPSSLPGVFAYQTRCPIGVCAIISPWNFPFNVPARKCTPALIAGNTLVFKPATLTPRTGYEFARLFADAGLPPGVLNFVTGSGVGMGSALAGDPRVKAISFTGSTNVGIKLNEQVAGRLVRTQLELGGKNPLVVLEDADLGQAVDACVTAAYACAGQWCTSTSRAVVLEKVAKEFTERVVEKTKRLRLGDGLREGTTMGPVCGTSQLQGILGYIEHGKKGGAKLLTGGARVTGPDYDDGCFVAPTVFGGVRPEMVIAQEEIFGPVLSIITAKDFDEAVEIANGVRFGLTSSIYTNDLKRAMMFLERTETGLTHVNMITAYKEPQLTFGGIKQSGFGIPEAGKTGLDFFTEHKVAYVRYR